MNITSELMHRKLRTARLKTADIAVKVYQHTHTGKWINYADCKTVFKQIDLEFLD